ncbi:hypothetical protein GALMADRAFT_275301 [Galerina marginata CBS 339.88]|uniref:Thioredoxin-like fold domain-containing protein n=1 Tax=Galerina marginata (strain CBS 339.88) TaxID=685588 RepID=A0A067TVY2_GALM3|nr:hypothetical protein GALMADRAFT_275301 [Galerina marginata CBS 339.88]
MALQPSLRPQIILGHPDAPHSLDIFLDYVCPYSAKIAFKIDKILKPLVGPGGPYEGKVKIIYRIQVQPWHAMSTLTSEAGLAVLRLSPENFWPFSLALYKHQEEYFDIPSQDLTTRQVREKLAQLAAEFLPTNGIEKFKDLLAFKGTPNRGNAVTDDLKYNIKFSRQNSIHVSPTVLLDGLVQNQVGSSWEEGDWKEYLSKQIQL